MSDNHLSQSTNPLSHSHSYTHQTLIHSLFIHHHHHHHHMSPPKPPIAAAAPPKKPITVAQTCNQLSSLLKEKGRLRDLINAKSDDKARMTVDLLSKMENSSDQIKEQSEKLKDLKPEDDVKKADYGGGPSSSESKASPMTIFYDGQVILIDDIPADRARDVMLAAGEHPSSTGKSKTEARVELDESTPTRPSTESSQPIPQRVQANGRDLPIARRASLHKFLAKRKDRATERAPYQMHNVNNPSVDAGTSKNDRNFDLNL